MKRKTIEAYISSLRILKTIIGDCKVEYLISDFEQAIISSFSSEFKNIKTGYCLFHFGQIVWRNVQSLGLSKYYSTDEIFRSYIRMFMCIGFEPEYRRFRDFSLLTDVFLKIYTTLGRPIVEIVKVFKRFYFTTEVKDVLSSRIELNILERLVKISP